MATPFNIIAQLQLQAPANLNTIVSSIQSRLSSITATVNININAASLTALNALTGQLNALNSILATVQTSATAAAAALAPLGGSLSRVHTNTQQINSALINTGPFFNQVATSAKQASNLLENFGVQAGLAARRYTAFLLAGGAIVGFINELRNAVGEAVSFQREMTRLAQVGNDTASSLKDIEGTITKLSINLGVSSKDLLGVSLQLRQAGLNASDTKIALDALAKSALAPSFGSLSDTTEGLISVMSQFKLSASDAERTLGAINAVSTQYAVSSKDIIDAIRRTGGAFHAAGGNLNELIALFGAVRSTSRESAESIGSSLRTILVRTQRSDFIEDMHRLGIELRYTREEATRLGNVNLANQFVGPFEAVRRLSEATKGLRSTDPRFAGISEELGGYRQISKTVPLLQEFAKAQEIYKTAQGGANSLTKSAEQAQGAFLVKITKVKEEFSALIRTVTESKGFQVFLDIVLQITSGLNKLAGALTPLIPLLAGLAAFQLARGTGRILGGFLAGASGQSPRFATGGIVSGSGDGDTVPAMLEPGEFVIRKQAAHRLGYDKLHHMNTSGEPQRFAQGGKPLKLRNNQTIGQLAIDGTPDIVTGSYDLERLPESTLNPLRHTVEIYAANSYARHHDESFKRVKRLNPKLSNTEAEEVVKEDKRVFNNYVQNLVKDYEAKDNVYNLTMKNKHDLDLDAKGNSPLWKPIAAGIQSGIEGITNKPMKSSPLNDKNFTDSVSGFLLEGIVSAHTGLAPAGGKASVDFRNIRGSIGKLRKIINLPNNSKIVPNNIDTKANLASANSIIFKALNANLFDMTPMLQDIAKEGTSILLHGAEQVIGGKKFDMEAWHAISGNVRGQRTAKVKAQGGIIQHFAHGGDVYDEFDPKQREWAKGWIDEYNTPDLPIHEKLLRTGESRFVIAATNKPEVPLTKPLPENLLPYLFSYQAAKDKQGPILQDPVISPYILPGKHVSLGQVPANITPKPKQLEGPSILPMDPVYLIAPGSPQQGGDKIVNLSVADLVDAQGKPAGKYGISADAIKRLQAASKTGVTGTVHSYTIASNATDVFNQEFLGPVNQAIDGVFKQKFATGHGKGLDYSLGPNELKTISGYLFERYISGLFGAQRNPEGQGYFDYPGPFPSREGLDKILYPHGPVKGDEGDAKNSYTKERTYELAGKWLNKYRGIKFAGGGEAAFTNKDLHEFVDGLSKSTGIDFKKFIYAPAIRDNLTAQLVEGLPAGTPIHGQHSYHPKGKKSVIEVSSAIKSKELLHGVIAHELGHAVDYYLGSGEPKSTESDTPANKYAKLESQVDKSKKFQASAEYVGSLKENFAEAFRAYAVGGGHPGFEEEIIKKVAGMTGQRHAGGGGITSTDMQKVLAELSKETGIDFNKLVKKYQVRKSIHESDDYEISGLFTPSASGKDKRGTISLASNTINNNDELKYTLAHELGHAADFYIGKNNFATAKNKNDVISKYATQHSATLTNRAVGKDEKYLNYLTDKTEAFADLFAEHITGKIESGQSTNLIDRWKNRGFKRKVIEPIAKSTNPNYEEHDLGFLGNLARKPGIVGGTARLFGYAQGGSSKDTVPALLTPGEFVINREAAQRIGYGRLHAMNQEGVARYAKGGPVYMATGAQVAAGVLPEMRSAVGNYAASAGVSYFDVSETSKVQASVQALKKYYDEYVENVRQQLLASGVIKDNLEGTRIATAEAEKDFAKLGPTLLAAGTHTQAQLDKLGLTAAATAERNIGGSLEARQKELEKTQGPLPIPTPAWYQTEMLAGSAAIPAAMAEHRAAHGLTGGQELSALTKRQIAAQALADNYDRMVKETSAELLATKQARSKVEADRLAVERAEALHRKLAEEAGLEVGSGGVRKQLGETAEAGGTDYLTRGQRLRRGLRRAGKSLYENRWGAAQVGVGLAAYYAGQALESQAGSAENAVLATDNDEGAARRYVTTKSAAGAVTGAVTGAAIGSQILPGWGTAIGAVVGGLGGLTTSLNDAAKEIAYAKADIAGKRFSVAVGRLERGEAGASTDIANQIAKADEATKEAAAKEQGWGAWAAEKLPSQSTMAMGAAVSGPMAAMPLLGMGFKKIFGETDEEKQKREDEAYRKANVGLLSKRQSMLELAASNYATSLKGGKPDIDKFMTGNIGGQSISSIVDAVAKTQGLGEEGKKDIRERLGHTIESNVSKLTSVREGAKVDAVTRDFELLVLSARNAASGLNDLARATKVTEDLFAGTVSAIQFRPPAEALDQMGGPNPKEFARSVKEIAAPFGERGQAFQSTALGLDEAQRRFSAGLPDMLKGYQINPLQSGEQLADALEKTIRGGKKSPEMDPIIDAMKSKLVNIGEGKQIQELIANPDKLRRQIFGDLQQDVTRTGQELSKILEASANAFSAASARFQQQLAQIGKVIDEQAKLTGEAMQIRARGRAELGGTLGTLALNTPLATREYSYRAVQTRLTGQAGLGSEEAFDPAAIGRRQREIQDEILARRETLDKQPGIRGGPDWDAAVNKIHELEKVSGDLSQALQHLGQVSERNAIIEERLVVLRKDQEARTNIAEKYLTGDPAARTQMYRGQMYAETIAKGGDIQQMAPGAIKDLMSFVQTAGGRITRDKTGTQITYTDLIHRAFENTNIPGFGPTNVGKLEIARGVAQQARNADVGEAALGQEAGNMRRMANTQFGMLAQGGKSDINVKLNENMEKLNESVKELRKAIEAAEQVPIAAGAATGGPVKYYGFGSAVFKPKGTDTVPAMLTPNEYVVNAKSAQANKALLEKINAAHGPLYLAGGGTASQQLVEQKVAAARQKYIDFLNDPKTKYYDTHSSDAVFKQVWENTKAEHKAQMESEIRIAKSASYPGAPTTSQEEIEAVKARHRKNIAEYKLEAVKNHEEVDDALIKAEQDDERVELQRLRHSIATSGRGNRGRGPQQPADMPKPAPIDAKSAKANRELLNILHPEEVKPTVADPMKELNKVIRATLPKQPPRIAVEGFNAERPDVATRHPRNEGWRVLGVNEGVAASFIRRNPFGGFAATDIIDGHLPRNIEEAGKVAQRRNLYDPYSKDSMLALYNRSRRGGRGDIGSANALIDAAKRAQIGEAGATAGMAGYRRGMGMVRSGRHIAGLGGGQYDWSTTGRATTQRIEENLNFVKFPIEADMKKRHHGADFTGFIDRLRLARGQGVASNPTVHAGNFRMVVDEHNNVIGRLIPGSGGINITRLDKFKNLKMGDAVRLTKSELDNMVKAGTATYVQLPQNRNQRIGHMATGGIVHGSDNIPALLTPGEFVLNASAASSLGYNRLQAINTKYLQRGGDVYEQNSGEAAREKLMRGPVTTTTSNVSPTGAGGNFGGDINRLSVAFTTFSTKVTEFANAVAKIPPSLAMTYNGNLNVNINGAEALAKIAEPLKDMVVTQATNAINHMISTRMGGEVPRLGGADVAAMNIEPEGINRAK